VGVKFSPIEPPRVFQVGLSAVIHLKDCARIELEPDEQVTFRTASGGEYDLARKSWGYYATPSLNARLPGFGLRAVLIRNRIDRYYVLLVERGKEDEFQEYLDLEKLSLVTWLDNTESLKRLERSLQGPIDE
jgi:hypothetical protein